MERTTRFELATLTLAKPWTLSAGVHAVRLPWCAVLAGPHNPQSSAPSGDLGLAC